MNDLAVWLLVQIDLDEQDLKENADWDHWMIKPSLVAARIRRIQAECEAKREIIVECAEQIAIGSDVTSGSQLAKTTLRAYGAMYATMGRQGYRPEWNPDDDD